MGELAGPLEGLQDRSPRNLVEHDPADPLALQVHLFFDQLAQMPGNRLALPVGVSGQIKHVRLGHGPADPLDVTGVLFYGLVLHAEVLFREHRVVLGHEVPDMAVRRKDFVPFAQITAQGGRLGRGFHDYQCLVHISRLQYSGRRNAGLI